MKKEVEKVEEVKESKDLVIKDSRFELTTSIKATINTGQYENIVPMYSIKEIGDIPSKITTEFYSEKINHLRNILLKKLQEDFDRIAINNIEKQNPNIRFYEKIGIKYPSVTEIIGWEGIDFPVAQLQQYGSRGTIKHKHFEHWIKTSEDLEIIKLVELYPELKEDYVIVNQGNLLLKFDDCDFIGFCKKYPEIIFSKADPFVVFNHEYKYAGLFDRLGTYDGKDAIFDWKFWGKIDNQKIDKGLRQLSAYYYALPLDIIQKVKYIIICPIINSLKAGYSEPIVETNIDKYFYKFLNDRKSFKKIYGV